MKTDLHRMGVDYWRKRLRRLGFLWGQPLDEYAMGWVYMIEVTVRGSNYRYVGKVEGDGAGGRLPRHRMREHVRAMNGGACSMLYTMMRMSHGKYKMGVLENVGWESVESVKDRETHWINGLNTRLAGLNSCK